MGKLGAILAALAVTVITGSTIAITSPALADSNTNPVIIVDA